MKNGLAKLGLVRKPRKSQAQRDIEDEDVRKRMNLVVKKDPGTNNDFDIKHMQPGRNAIVDDNNYDDNLKEYYDNKARKGTAGATSYQRGKGQMNKEEFDQDNFNLQRYQSVHADEFSARQQAFNEEREEENEDGFGPMPRRSRAFNDVLFGADGPMAFGGNFGEGEKEQSLFGFDIVKKESKNSQKKEQSSDSDREDGFGEKLQFNKSIVPSDEKDKEIILAKKQENKIIEDQDDEENDQVPDLDNFFNRNRNAYANRSRRIGTENVEIQQVEENDGNDEKGFEERIRMITGGESGRYGTQGGKQRAQSFIQLKRQELKEKRIQKQNDLGAANSKDPAQSKIDEVAINQVEQFLKQAEIVKQKTIKKKSFGKTEADLKLIKELLIYQAALDAEDYSDQQSNTLNGNIFQDTDFMIQNDDDADSDDGTGFLTDFYQELNLDNDTNHKQSDLFTTKVESGNEKSNYLNNLEQIEALRGAMIPFIDKNERAHQLDAKKSLKKNAQLDGLTISQKQHVLSERQQLVIISTQLLREREASGGQPMGPAKSTFTISMNEDLYFIGNAQGELKMYGKEDQDLYATFKEKGKEFANNAITAITVHPTRNDYILIGYEQGQIVLFDACNSDKSLKIIKDVHKGVPIANLSFCDLIKKNKEEKNQSRLTDFGNQFSALQNKVKKNKNEPDQIMNPYGNLNVSQNAPEESPNTTITKKGQGDEQEWMFISIDQNGKVVINHVSKVVFIFKSSKQILVEPAKGAPKFLSLGCRFRNILHPQIAINDFVTLVAIGSTNQVIVLAITKEKSQIIKELERPKYKNTLGEIKDLNNILPSVAWGYGHSPMMKDKCYATLAVGWGPLIQMFVLNDITDQKQTFIEDGFYVIEQQSPQSDQTSSPSSDNNRSKDTSTSDDLTLSQRQVLEQINPYEQQSRFEAIQQELIHSRQSSMHGRELSPFELHSMFIEDITYISDSVLLVLTKSLQYKIFYTQRFQYGIYSHEEWRQEQKVPGVDKKKETASIDEGTLDINLAQSEYGPSYHSTYCQINGQIIALGVKGMYKINQIRWDDSLQEFKKMTDGNWIWEFARAIDIYTGKIKGFKDVPEEQFMRQETMKADLKLYIRTIISEQLEIWGEEDKNSQPSSIVIADPGSLDESNMDILNLLDPQKTNQTTEKMAKYRTLFAIAIEFCVTISDWYFLFYDLFLLFEEEQLADIFLDELKPFIMAGRFSDHDLPNDILQNHIINYYKDPHQPEQIEKIIINLNLSDCPKSAITELIQFSEENFLSTALLYLHTSIYDPKDEESCQRLILALLELYRQATKTNPGSFQQLRQIGNLSPDSIERLRAEKSQLYIGYKVLWVIRLFLNGKMFPQGNIPEARWRKYVHEIVDCITRENVMLDLLSIDAEAYFQIISILFYKGKVFEFLREDKIQQDKVIKTQQSLIAQPLISNDLYEERFTTIILSHNQILARFEKVCCSRHENDYKVPDDIRLQYLFFVANVASKSNIKKDAKFYLSCMKELLNQSQNFLKFNQNLIKRAANRKRSIGQLDKKIKDENKHIYASETALLDLMDLCEPLDDAEVEDLIIKTRHTKFNQLRVKLLERKEDLCECLSLFVDGMKANSYAATKRESVVRIFDWINNVLDAFMAKKTSKNQEPTAAEDALRKQIMIEFSGLVNIDATLTFLLIDEKFDQDHEKFVKTLSASFEQQHKYLETMLQTHHEQIQSSLEEYFTSGLQGAARDRAESYMRLQSMHLRLVCEHYPEKVLDRVRRIKKNEIHFALDDCLAICQEFNQVEACAMFTNKMGNYFTSVTRYMTLLTDKQYFDYPQLLQQICRYGQAEKQIPHYVPYQDKAAKTRNKELMRSNDKEQGYMVRFDYIIRKVLKIIGKESTDNFNDETIDKIWFFTLDSILRIKSEQTKMVENLRDLLLQKIEENQLLVAADKQSDREAVQKKYGQHIASLGEFFKSRIAIAIEHTLKWIELGVFLDHIVGHDEDIEFTELREMIFSIFTEVSSECQVLKNANRSANQYTISSFAKANTERSSGILFRYRQCNLCSKFLDEIAIAQRKKNELAQFRRGTVMQRPAYGSGDSDEEDFEMPFIDPFDDELTLYECGHAFHIKCIERYITERAEPSRQGSQGKRAPAPVAQETFEKQQCPSCYSDKFKLDFEAVFAKANKRGVGAPSRQTKDSLAESTHSSGSSDTGEQPRKPKRPAYSAQEKGERIMAHRQQRNASVARKQRSLQEQKLDIFGGTFASEGVTLFNFKM